VRVATVGAEPVEAFLDAANRADLARAYSVLAPDAELVLPSLRATLVGRNQLTSALEAVVTAFPDLRYTTSSRYLTPGQVTDEAVLTGVRLGPWGQVPPSGKAHRLPARVVLEHEGGFVTRVTLWADSGSLRALVDDSVDLRSSSGVLVSSLRATMPASDQRIFVGAARDATAAPQRVGPAPRSPGPELNSASAKAAELRVPMPRRVRRALVVSASAGMAAGAIGIASWVVQGALAAPEGVDAVAAVSSSAAPASPSPSPSVRSPKPTPKPTSTPAPKPTPTPEPAFTQEGNLITLNTDLTFAVDSAELNDGALQALMRIMGQVRDEKRSGTITVNGFTDSDGNRRHNLELSRARAQAVAAILRKGLADRGIQVRSAGYGEDRPKADNATAIGKAANRRVEITVPGTG
jgi:OOP family OmpA-OmpF porin